MEFDRIKIKTEPVGDENEFPGLGKDWLQFEVKNEPYENSSGDLISTEDIKCEVPDDNLLSGQKQDSDWTRITKCGTISGSIFRWKDAHTSGSIPTSVSNELVGSPNVDRNEESVIDEGKCKLTDNSQFHPKGKIDENVIIKFEDRQHEQMRFSCNFCKAEFLEKRQVERHMFVHTKKPYKCPVCGKAFGRKSYVSVHMVTHTKERRFNCDVCNKKFTQRSTWVEHMRIHTKEKPYKCDVCPKTFTQRSSMRRHLHTHATERSYRCELCDKMFASNARLNKHSKTHTDKKLFKCHICEKAFAQRKYLSRHSKIHQTTEEYQCNSCNKSFALVSGLYKHIADADCSGKQSKSEHKKMSSNSSNTFQEPFDLEHLNEENESIELLQLSNRHQDEIFSEQLEGRGDKASNMDPACNKAIADKCHLERHPTKCIRNEAWKCSECDKKCSNQSTLKTHMRTHAVEKPRCDVCNKTFTQISSWKVHKLIHTKEKPFKCGFCNKEFNQKSYLTTHLRIHTNEKPYICDLCGKCFTCTSHLYNHFKTHAKQMKTKTSSLIQSVEQKPSIPYSHSKPVKIKSPHFILPKASPVPKPMLLNFVQPVTQIPLTATKIILPTLVVQVPQPQAPLFTNIPNTLTVNPSNPITFKL